MAFAPHVRLAARDRHRLHEHRGRWWRTHEQQQRVLIIILRLDVDGGSNGSSVDGNGDGSGTTGDAQAPARPAADGVWRGRAGDTGGATLVAFRERQRAAVALRGARRIRGRHWRDGLPLRRRALAPAVRRTARSDPVVFHAKRHLI